MKQILIGSSAMKYHYGAEFERIPKDEDWVVDDKSYVALSTRDVEYHYIPIISNKYSESSIIKPHHLLALKMSHLFWDNDWDKHMFDIQFMLNKGAYPDMVLFHELYEYWKENLPFNRRSNLTLNNEEFFNNAIQSDHDELHRILTYPNSPTYLKILKNGADVEPDEEKFYCLSHEDKLKLVREEVMVMAFERMPKLDYRVAYNKMIKKFIRNHAPIWEAVFIIEFYKKLMNPEFNYIKKLEYELTRNNTKI